MKKTEKKKDEKFVLYNVALTDHEILLYAQMIDQFKKGEIDYQTLHHLFLNHGVTIEPRPRDFSNLMMSITKAESIKKRISEGNYLYGDIDCFVLNSDVFKNVVFRMDYKAIEVLADYGVPEYQDIMISILMNQIRLTFPKDEIAAAKISKWERRIAELDASLAKKEVVNRTK